MTLSLLPLQPALPSAQNEISQTADAPLLVFKEAMEYLRVSRSTLYRFMWSGQLTGHKVGSTWRFYRKDLDACVTSTPCEKVPMEASL